MTTSTKTQRCSAQKLGEKMAEALIPLSPCNTCMPASCATLKLTCDSYERWKAIFAMAEKIKEIQCKQNQ